MRIWPLAETQRHGKPAPQEIQDRFRRVTTQRVEQRLAHTLIRLAAQSGKKVQEGILIDHALSR